MSPEIRSLLARAATNRFILAQLIDQVPADRWDRYAPGDTWSVRDHLCHLATSDDLVALLLEEPEDGAFRLGIDLQYMRIPVMGEMCERSLAEILAAMVEARRRLEATLSARCDDAALALPVIIDTPGEWPSARQMSLRAYLAAWAEHDVEHTAAIRAAIVTPPSARDLSLAAWFGRR